MERRNATEAREFIHLPIHLPSSGIKSALDRAMTPEREQVCCLISDQGRGERVCRQAKLWEVSDCHFVSLCVLSLRIGLSEDIEIGEKRAEERGGRMDGEWMERLCLDAGSHMRMHGKCPRRLKKWLDEKLRGGYLWLECVLGSWTRSRHFDRCNINICKPRFWHYIQ